MRVLLTETARDHFGDDVRSVSTAVELVTMDANGLIRLADGAMVTPPAGEAEIAWATADLFDADAPLHPFFDAVSRASTLRWLQSPAAGTDDPLFARLIGRGVAVTNAHVNSVGIADYVLRAVLDHVQDVGQWRRAQSERAWRRHDFTELADTTWLIIGFGSIGRDVAVRARAFGARIIGVRRHPNGEEPVDRMIRPDETVSAVAEADVVVVCAPATAATSHLVDEAFLSVMRPGSLLLNVSRGSLVDEPALIRALDRGAPAAAVLDVFDVEPLPPEHPLWAHPSVSVTAHNAAGGTGRYRRAAQLFVDNLARYLDGRPLRNRVTPADVTGGAVRPG